jgi:hypothetical protein
MGMTSFRECITPLRCGARRSQLERVAPDRIRDSQSGLCVIPCH